GVDATVADFGGIDIRPELDAFVVTFPSMPPGTATIAPIASAKVARTSIGPPHSFSRSVLAHVDCSALQDFGPAPPVQSLSDIGPTSNTPIAGGTMFDFSELSLLVAFTDFTHFAAQAERLDEI